MKEIEESFLSFMRSVVTIVCTIFWIVIGILFWIPLLIRVTAVYCAAVLAAALTQSDASHLKCALETAVRFYTDGFRMILETFENTDLSSGNNAISDSNYSFENKFNMNTVIFEIAWTILFWGSFLGFILFL